jgi:MFS family permease
LTRVKTFTSDTFRALRTRNFRLFFWGQLVSNTGTWMQTVALGWLVLQLTKSGFAVGVVTALQFLPSLLFGIYGGVVADRFDKRRTLLATQSGMAVCAAALAGVTLAGSVQLWMIYLLTFMSGCFTAIDTPVRQAFVSEMVPPEGLPNAIAINSAMFNLSRIAGPAAGAIVIKAVGVGICFAFNAGSFIAVLFGLMMMRPAELFRGRPVARAKGQIREGLRYVWENPVLRSTILVMTVVGTLAFNWTVTLPLLAKFTFHGDAGTYGLMTTLMGAGALVGALSSARATPSSRRLAGSCLAFGVLMTLAAFAPNRMTVYMLIVLTGVASMTFLACANSICQLSTTAAMRGRVMSIYALVFLGSTPVGGPLIGWISQQLSPRYGVAVGGVATVVAGLAVAVLLARGRLAGSMSGSGLLGRRVSSGPREPAPALVERVPAASAASAASATSAAEAS